MESSLPRPATRTASRCFQETARGTHVFTVDGYSLLRGFAVGQYISSATFAVGGYDWCIQYYPGGHSDDDISIALRLMSKGAEVRAFFSFRLVDQVTDKSELVYTNSGTAPVVLNNNNIDGTRCTCCVSSIEKSEVEGSAFLVDDLLVIECDLTVLKRTPVTVTEEEATMASDVIHQQASSSDLSRDMLKMLKAEVGADVTFKVAGEVFTAHRVVLAARSPVFKAELYGLMRAARGNQIAIRGMQPAVFGALLHFMYTDSLSPDMDDLDGEDKMEFIKHLLRAADRYDVDKLKTLCENSLSKSLGVENVVNTFALADQHNCHRLKDACVQFIASLNRLDDVVESKGYGRLKRSCPDVLLDVFERATKSRKII